MIIPGTRTCQVKQAGWRDWAPAVAGAFGPLGVMASNMMAPRTAPQTSPTTAQLPPRDGSHLPNKPINWTVNPTPPQPAPQTSPTTAQLPPRDGSHLPNKPINWTVNPTPPDPTQPDPVSSWRNAPGTMPQGNPQLQRKWGDGPATTAASLMMPLPFLMARSFFNRGRQQQHQHYNPQKTNRATTQPSSPYELTPEQRQKRIKELETPLTQEDRDNWQGGILPQSNLQRRAQAE